MRGSPVIEEKNQESTRPTAGSIAYSLLARKRWRVPDRDRSTGHGTAAVTEPLPGPSGTFLLRSLMGKPSEGAT